MFWSIVVSKILPLQTALTKFEFRIKMLWCCAGDRHRSGTTVAHPLCPSGRGQGQQLVSKFQLLSTCKAVLSSWVPTHSICMVIAFDIFTTNFNMQIEIWNELLKSLKSYPIYGTWSYRMLIQMLSLDQALYFCSMMDSNVQTTQGH